MAETREIIAFVVENDEGKRERSDSPAVFTAKDERTYTLVILKGGKVDKTHIPEKCRALYYPEEEIENGVVEIGDLVELED